MATNNNIVSWVDYQQIIKDNCTSNHQQIIDDNIFFNHFKSVFNDPRLGKGLMICYSLRNEININYAKCEVAENKMIENEYAKDCFALHFCLGGAVRKPSNELNENVTFSKGNFVLYKTKKGKDYIEIIKTDECYEVIGVQFSADSLKQFFSKYGRNLPAPFNKILQQPNCIYQMGSMDEEMYLKLKSFPFDLKDDISYRLSVESKLFELIAHSIKQLTEKKRVLISPNDETIISNARKFMKENIGLDLSIDDISKGIYSSKSKILQLFKENYGRTPFEFLKDMRLMEAKRLLENKMENVNGAAFKVGYESTSSFSKAFLKKFGARPGSFMAGINNEHKK